MGSSEKIKGSKETPDEDQPSRSGVRLVSLVGFGAVLALMGIIGAESVRVLHSIESENVEVTRDYLSRHHALDRVRSSLYLSGTLVRDYLLDPDQGRARSRLAELQEVRAQTNAALDEYRGDGLSEDVPQLATLRAELAEYWKTISPSFDWDAGQRRSLSYRFLEQLVLPRRDAMLRLADRVDGMNEAVLKAGGLRSAEIYRSFRSRIVAILTITLGLGIGVAGLSIMQILRLERDARLRYQETVRARSELENLSAKLVDAQEEERRTISRELHDEVGQSLSALLVDLGNVVATVPEENVPARRLLDTVKKLAEQSLQSVRNRALLLRPSMLDDFGLVPALRWQTREASRRTGTIIELAAEETADELPDDYKTCVYRVVQEALNNVSKHSNAQSVQIVVRQEKNRLLLSIQDDGKGFDALHTRGLGLVGMEERVRHLGGVFVIQSKPGQGTHLRVDLPLRGESSGLYG